MSRIRALLPLLIALAFQSAAAAGTQELQFSRVEGAGGVSLAVVQAGNKNGPQILFIHGFSQSYMSWHEQLNDPELARRFHLVAFDLRGHGASAKPSSPADYTSETWAADLAAVIAATGSRRPVLVAWSMGGAVAASYVKHHGVDQIAGISLVAVPAIFSASVVDFDSGDRRRLAQQDLIARMNSDDILSNCDGTRGFVRMLTAEPLSPAETQLTVAYNLMTPAFARRAMFASYKQWWSFPDLPSVLTVPVLISHGTADELLPFENSVSTSERIRGSKLSSYAGAGHALFLENPNRFDRELARFTLEAQRTLRVSESGDSDDSVNTRRHDN